MRNDEKRSRLHTRLNELAPFVLAFSAGKDSAFLAKEASAAVGRNRFTAVFIDSALSSAHDHRRLEYFRKRMDLAVQVVRLDPFSEKEIVRNDPDRCYYCKRFLFGSLKRWMEKEKLPSRLIDGSTASDAAAYRPGARAAAELGVVSPLQEAGFTSAEIAESMKDWRVPAVFTLSSSCLATRVPYGRPLNQALLKRIEAMEEFWHERGVFDIRCRAIEAGCRIEVPRNRLSRVLKNRETALERAWAIGFRWLALDLDPVRCGPWDPAETDQER